MATGNRQWAKDDDQLDYQSGAEKMETFRQSSEEFGSQEGDYSWVLETGTEIIEGGKHSGIQEPSASYGVQDFTGLRVWSLGIDLVELTYRLTRSFPHYERFGLAGQLQGAAVSVPSNIAEGNARNRTGDYLRFLTIARGSLAEVKTQLIVARRLGCIDQSTANESLAKGRRSLTATHCSVLYSRAIIEFTQMSAIRVNGSYCPLPIAHRPLPIAHCPLPIAHRLQEQS